MWRRGLNSHDLRWQVKAKARQNADAEAELGQSMELNSENPLILQKTRELCQAILDQPDFQNIRRQVDLFLADEKIRVQYQELSDRGALLQHKQQTGTPLDMTEISDFEQRREVFLSS